MVCSLDKKETSLNYMLSRKDKIYLTNGCHNFEVIKYLLGNTISNRTVSKYGFPTLHFFLGIAFSNNNPIFKR